MAPLSNRADVKKWYFTCRELGFVNSVMVLGQRFRPYLSYVPGDTGLIFHKLTSVCIFSGRYTSTFLFPREFLDNLILFFS